MPVYTYRCDDCGIQFDQTQKFTDDSLTKCPECGKNSLHKVYTPVVVVFKGSGFYATDHRSPSGGISTPPGDKKEEKPGESKPASDSSAEKPAEAAKPAAVSTAEKS